MKRYLVILLMFLGMVATVNARTIPQDKLEKIIEAKLRMIVERLQLTEQQQSEFTPIYTRYSNEMAKQFETYRKKERELRANKQENALKILNVRFESREKALKIQRSYYEKFAKVLTPDQLLKLELVENEIQRKIMDQYIRKNKKR